MVIAAKVLRAFGLVESARRLDRGRGGKVWQREVDFVGSNEVGEATAQFVSKVLAGQINQTAVASISLNRSEENPSAHGR